MRIVLNSDIVYSTKPAASGLPSHIAEFCKEAHGAGAVLVLPRTTLLENRRSQERLVQEAVTAIEGAARLLASYGLKLPPFNAVEMVSQADLVSQLKATGIQVEIEEPTFDDYRNAEERACLHLSPHPPETKSDEMRDLVIWEIALRIAKKDGKAILLSRDVVHVHERGASEADSAGLLRADTVDDALDLLGRESPAGALSREILATVWDTIRNNGVPLPAGIAPKRLTALSFTADERGHATGSFGFAVETPKGTLSATIEVIQSGPNTVRADLSNLQLGNAPWTTERMTVTAPGELPIIARSEDERLTELRSILEGSK